jgi:aryl-phospho-beta-D-glucosidase BglC (GH1 family)
MRRLAAIFMCCVLLAGSAVATAYAAEQGPGYERQQAQQNEPDTPLAKNGRLRVEKTVLVNEKGEPVLLKGVSTHGINWFPEYVNASAFRTLRDEWGVNCVRLAMYTEEYNGYCAGGDREALKAVIDRGVREAGNLGMYVIIDWHILSDGDPRKNQAQAVEFFGELAGRYRDQKHVLYEICNEPNGGVSWADIKSYAKAVIGAVREQDKESVILVGTPTWSQDVDLAAESPLEGVSNVMYTFHFYAATHGEVYRTKVARAVEKGLPVFVSEFGVSEASGNGRIDTAEGDRWIAFLKERGIGYVYWNLSNKAESCALLTSKSPKTGAFQTSDLSASGLWFRGK